MRLSILLGVSLAASVAGSYFYINMQKAQIAQLQVELQTAVNNQQVLESTIAQQNTQMQEQLENQRQNQVRIAELSEMNDEARQEVTEMRNTFARHDMNSLAIARPESIQRIINTGTSRVHAQFVDLTNPGQFDETPAAE
jgi:preprotein translocase subunit SecD|tara:strand:+ start:674 stop:1093 length:420 start_codon:yes stop_codon:yes gene_type:complete